MTPHDDARLKLVQTWLESLADQFHLHLTSLATASSDASFRRYFRIATDTGSLIVMDAPAPHENCQPFVQVTDILQQADINVPQIVAQNTELGFMLLTDLGKTTYLDAIKKGLDDSQLQHMYRDAIATLIAMQHASTSTLESYTEHRLSEEMKLFPQWYVKLHCGASLSETESAMLQRTFALLSQDNMKQPSVFVHRDFHSPNLMLVNDSSHRPNPGVIDYQDAIAGPLSYDIASLVMDARTTWEEPQQLDWAIRYWEAARHAKLPVPPDFADFHRAYEWMGLQRNLRILGVFARLAYRDQKHQYLEHIPRVNGYIRQVAGRYSVFTPLLRLFDRLENREIKVGYTF